MRRSWFGAAVKQHKSPSLDLLKSLYGVLVKNAIVTDHNRTLIVEVLRSIAETVIWGDQNDPRVFDYFLEKGIQSYFLSIIEQPKCGTYVCTQLLQTLNILFENIRNETATYFLLSNNHVNSVICHEFDFSDEEIMAYYISFLKTLSLKLNSNTIHFFYNEHLRDFPLYTEAIKFFNHNESMVRIAVRTLTLNVYKVGDEMTLKFIHDKTSAPYFSNLVWFIGNNLLMMERCLRTEATHLTRNKLESLVALHLDDIHYVHDIFQLQIQSLNTMLCEHLLNTLFIPLYVYSLDPSLKVDSPQVSVKCALFLLSQVFLVLNHPPLVKQLKLYICFEENPHLESSDTFRRFAKPISQIQDTLRPAVIPRNKQNLQPTQLAKEHKEELRAREAKRLTEESKLRDMERYPKRQEFNQTGYLKSILEPDPGIDPLLGARVHRVDSLKNISEDATRSRESSTMSKESSVYSEAVFVDSEECATESFTELLSAQGSEAGEENKVQSQDQGTAPPSDKQADAPHPDDEQRPVPHDDQNLQQDYAVSDDSGIVSSETMENVGQDIEDVIAEEQGTDPEVPPGTSQSRDHNHSQSEARQSSPALESESSQTLDNSRHSSDSTENGSFDTDIKNSRDSPKFRSPIPEQISPEQNGDKTITVTGDELNLSKQRCLASPKSASSEESHFADAFHCPPARSCIFYDALLSCLELGEDDTEALFSAALLYAMFTNSAMPHKPPAPYYYDDRIIDRLLNILEKACHPDSIVRLVTVEIAVRLLTVLTSYNDKILLQDNHIAVLTAVKENSVRHVRVFYTGTEDSLFVEVFDEEFKQLNLRRKTKVDQLMSDECMLLGPVYTPLTGIDFAKRLPCGDIERMRKSLIVFFTIRQLWQRAVGEEEAELPLLNLSLQVTQGDILNLNHSDLIACTVITEREVAKRFLVIDTHQLILVEPDNAPTRLGHGVVQFVAPLQNVDAKPDKDNNRNLIINIEKTSSNTATLRAKFQFEDHIRCFAAKTRLKQGRESLQKLKCFKLTRVLDIRDQFVDEPYFTSRSPVPVVTKTNAYPTIGKSKPEIGRTSRYSVPSSHSPVPTTPTSSLPGTPGSSRKSTKSLSKLPDPEVV